MSLGLRNAGWILRFAVEKNADAFSTYEANFLDSEDNSNWPKWLAKTPHNTSQLLEKHQRELRSMRGKVTLIAGAPPCQGFSLAGRRVHSDPRNSLFQDYLDFVSLIRPRFLLLENVQGFDMPFKVDAGDAKPEITYSNKLASELDRLGYKVFSEIVDLSRFGVPQTRRRFILIAIRKRDELLARLSEKPPFQALYERAEEFLKLRGLRTNAPTTAHEALADLEITGSNLEECDDTIVKGFKQVRYTFSGDLSAYARLMRRGCSEAPNSMRLPRHNAVTVQQFNRIRSTCKPGQSICDADRKRLGIKKHALTPLARNLPSATVTTLPDDIIHYAEARILTVRENARLQSFPDSFVFKGKYTTGGMSRRHDCPRYSQVGNAVPPLFAEALGSYLHDLACGRSST
jgi:DNA (cytosine-5)-methyltransferase 1